MDFAEIFGILGSIGLCLCGFPQAWKSFKDKHADGMAFSTVLLWLLGELFMLLYVVIKHTKDIPLMTNYIVSAFSVVVISRYKFWPKN